MIKGYLVYNENAVFGIGNTVDDAYEDAIAEVGYLRDENHNEVYYNDPRCMDLAKEQFDVIPATQAAIDYVNDYGGQYMFDEIDGVAHSPEGKE